MIIDLKSYFNVSNNSKILWKHFQSKIVLLQKNLSVSVQLQHMSIIKSLCTYDCVLLNMKSYKALLISIEKIYLYTIGI